LKVNNIEVIYNSVILVLKGVSLKVPRAVSRPCGGMARQNDDAQGRSPTFCIQKRGEVYQRVDQIRANEPRP